MRLLILNILFLREYFCYVYEDTEEFSSYIGRFMNDDAWKIIIQDIEFLKIRCSNTQIEEFDLYDYLYNYGETFEYLKWLFHLPGGFRIFLHSVIQLWNDNFISI